MAKVQWATKRLVEGGSSFCIRLKAHLGFDFRLSTSQRLSHREQEEARGITEGLL